MSKRATILERTLNKFGWYKQVAVTTSAAFGFDEPADYKTENYLAAFTSWVFGCVRARANDVAGIELRLFKVKNRSTGEVEEIIEHDALSLLRTVNQHMTFRDLIKATQTYKDLSGEAFWLLIKGTKSVAEIQMLRPDYIKVLTDAKTFVKGYEYQVPGKGPIRFERDEIIHFKEFNPVNPYRGLSIIRAAAVTIDTDNFAEKYNRQFFKNSAIPSAVFTSEQTLTQEYMDRLRSQWERVYGGQEKAGKTAFLGGGLTLKPFALSQKDMEFLEGQRFTRDKIFALFQTPKTVLGMVEDVNRANAEATDYVFAKRVIKPAMEAIRDTLNEFLLPQYDGGEDLFFTITDPVPEDTEAKLKRHETLFKVGAITQNEIRAEEGLDEVDGLDRFWLPLNIQPVTIDEQGGKSGGGKTIEVESKKKRGRIKIPTLTIRQKVIKEIVSDIKTKFIRAIAPGVSNGVKLEEQEGLGRSQLTPEQKDAFWKQLISTSEVFEKKFLEKVKEFFARQKKDVLEKLENKKAVKFSKNEIEEVLFSLTDEGKIAANILVPILVQFMEEAGNEALDLVSHDTVAFDAATESVMQFKRVDALKGIKAMNKVTKYKLRSVLSQGVDDGLSIPQLGKKIREVFDEADRVRSLKIARTEVLKAGNRGALEAYKQSRVVVGKEWFTSLDERVCQWCSPMQGRVKRLDTNFFNEGESFLGNKGGTLSFNLHDIDVPPLHPNCRCTLVPVTVSQRISEDPKKKEEHPIDRDAMKEEITREVEETMEKKLDEVINAL